MGIFPLLLSSLSNALGREMFKQVKRDGIRT